MAGENAGEGGRAAPLSRGRGTSATRGSTSRDSEAQRGDAARRQEHLERVENVNDDIVRRALSQALYDKSRPVPEANLKMLVDSALSGGPCDFQVLRFALKRPELSAETLCGYYDDLVKLQLEQERSEFMTGYLANPNLPCDISRRAWREPSLSECRKQYFSHGVCLGKAEHERASAELDELARERNKKKLKRAEWTKRLDRILRKYLPKDAPEGWTKAMP